MPRPNPSTPPTVRLGLVQHACGPDKPQNLDVAIELIRQAAAQGAQVIATQELFTTQYFPQTEDAALFDLAEPIPGPTTQRLAALAKELQVEIIASIFEQRAQGLYHNTCLLFDTQGQLAGRYRKMHIPEDPRFYEKFYFTPGDAPATAASTVPTEPAWPVHATRHAAAGMLICWDQWFPEAARLMALAGAQVLFYPTAIGWHHSETPQERARQREAWQIMQRAHAIANGVFVAAINRVGTEDELQFWGTSFVADPGGRVIAQASGDQPEALLVDCDLTQIDEARRGWPFLRDRRVDAYAGLTHRYLKP